MSERVIVHRHGCHTALHFGVKAKENQDEVPSLYWLTLTPQNPYFANSSFCTTTELSKLLTSRRVAEIQIFEKTYLIVIKDETCLKFKLNDSTLFLIGSYAQKLVASY